MAINRGDTYFVVFIFILGIMSDIDPRMCESTEVLETDLRVDYQTPLHSHHIRMISAANENLAAILQDLKFKKEMGKEALVCRYCGGDIRKRVRDREGNGVVENKRRRGGSE